MSHGFRGLTDNHPTKKNQNLHYLNMHDENLCNLWQKSKVDLAADFADCTDNNAEAKKK